MDEIDQNASYIYYLNNVRNGSISDHSIMKFHNRGSRLKKKKQQIHTKNFFKLNSFDWCKKLKLLLQFYVFSKLYLFILNYYCFYINDFLKAN